MACSGARKTAAPNRQAMTFCCLLVLGSTPSAYCAPACTAGNNSAPLSRRNADSATCNTFQIIAVAFSIFLNRLATVVRNRTAAQGKEKEAYRLLNKGYRWFTEGFDTKDLQEAKTMLEELT